MQVNGQTVNTTSFSYDLPRISTISPQWLLSSNPTMYIEGANFGPLNANRSVLFHDHNTTQTFVCPTVTWLAHSSLKCEFTNVSLPLYARFNVTVSVGGYRNPDSNMAEFRTGFLNVAPVVPTLQAVMQEDEELLLELYSYDPDAGDTVQVFVALNPQWGTLFQVTQSNGKGSLINASLASVPVVHSQSKILYIPPENYFGNDSFQVFAIDDKGSQSLTQTIDIIVDAVQDPPVPRSAVINLDEDTTAVIEFKVDDPDQNTTDNITITILAIPQYGSLSIQNGSGNSSNWVEVLNTPFVLPLNVTSAIFRPVNDTNGSPYGTVVFKAQDRYVESIINGTVVINVRAVNDPPVFNRASLNSSVYEDTPTTFVFNVTDADQHDLLVVKVHNLSINGSLYAVSQDLRDSDIIKSSSPLGEGSEIKGPPYKILFSPLKNVFNPIDSTPQRFDISISDRSITLFERILFSIAPVNDVPKLSCGNPTIVELSTDFITNMTASVDVRIDATDVDDSGLFYHLVGVPTKGKLIADLRADPLDLGDTFVSPNMKYYFDSQGGVYPFANFTVVARDSHNSSSSNCTYVFSFK
ncbi:hypothetical protein BKA69DRAFT_674024 [Paraphysoderma sedebokerense]|nr:hypothetical protein BKA69DRAFT_674024 [Paraphysoderma sedebokerense]